MREIKFRAWIKPTKRMANVTGLCYQSQGLGVEVMKVNGLAIDDPSHQEFWNNDNEAVLMQYTGLKDKNGKEIYEGDILIHHKYNVNNCIVKWVTDSCGFFLHNWALTKLCTPNIEVIGNIYENAELLHS